MEQVYQSAGVSPNAARIFPQHRAQRAPSEMRHQALNFIRILFIVNMNMWVRALARTRR